MATTTPLPSFFLPAPGEPAIPFKTWEKMFKNYCLVIDVEGQKWTDARQRALLLHCLGTEGQRIFYTLDDTGTTLETALKALNDYFTPKVNVVVERHAFRKRAQLRDESIVQYIAALRHLAVTCEFENSDDMIRDQLVEHCANPHIRERLLLKTKLKLKDAITLACQIESAGEQAKAMASASRSSLPVQAVQVQSRGKGRQQRSRGNARSVQPTSRSTSTPTNSRACFRCGSDKHLANAPECPAIKAVCKDCNKKGHFARVCRSAQTHKVQQVEVPEYTMLLLQQSDSPAKLHCTVDIRAGTAKKTVKLTVDTGASVSVLPKCLVEENFKGVPLQPPAARLVTYSKTPITVLGCMPATVVRDNDTCKASFYVTDSGTPLMGMDLITALKLRIEGNTVLPTSSASKPVLQLSMDSAAESPSVGCVEGFMHKVKIRDNAKPVRQKLRRLPFAVRSAVSDELQRLLSAGVIERVDASPWVSNIVVTQKKTGSIRMCADLREPNKALVVDSHPLPHMEELLTKLAGSTLFSTIDLESAYHQLPLHPDSRDLTAFITHEGLFRYCRVPYGLASAPAAFQKMMSTVLAGVPNVQCYLDDVICHGRTQAEHDTALNAVLSRLRKVGLRLNEKKCQFRQPSLRFLGHLVTAQGIEPDKEHVQAIKQAPPPTDPATLRSFLGMLSWYNKFIPNYATVVEPLRACLRTDTEFSWTAEADKCFSKVKQLLVHSSALALYDPTLPCIISTDASDYGIGAVFTQIHPDDSERTVAFASRTLTQAERKYATVEKEALACVWAVEKWRTYLWGHRFTLRTDHQALTTLLCTKGTDRAGMRIARWSARLLCFNYDVIYRAGALNQTADCLSRLPLPTSDADEHETEPEVVAMLSTAQAAITPAEFTSSSELCPELSALRLQIQKGWPRSLKAVSPDLQPYFKIRHGLSVHENLVLRGSRFIVPLSLRKTLVVLAHEDHQGIGRTKQRLRELYWFPGMDEMAQSYAAGCTLCPELDRTAKTFAAPLQPVPLPTAPWTKLGLDIVGPFETATWNCRYAITLTDYYTKWPEVAFTPSITTETVISFLKSTFSRYGNPECVVTDNGPQLISTAMSTFFTERNIKHTRVSVYHPASNGAVERFNRVLKGVVQSAIVQNTPWKETVTSFLHTYRATPHAMTGVSPFELMYGRKMRTKLAVMPLPPCSNRDEEVRNRVSKRQSQMKAYCDKKRGARTPAFKVGDKVRVRIQTHVPKGHPKFTHPVQIQKQVGPCTFELADGKNWHSSQLSRVPDAAVMPPDQRADDKDADEDAVTPTPEQPPTAAAEVPAPERNQPADRVQPARERRPPEWMKDYET